jgi:RNAse (barnase) inhibitor barstar
MRLIELDAKGWKSQLDFLQSLTRALGSCEGHGMSPDAFVDSMIWDGMNSVGPPYTVQIRNLNAASREVADYVSLMVSAIKQGRHDRFQRYGGDIEVRILELPSH